MRMLVLRQPRKSHDQITTLLIRKGAMMWLPREISRDQRLGLAGLFGVWRLEDAMKPKALRFIKSWSADDAYDRFGSAGIGGQEWLEDELLHHGRRAFVAVNSAGVIGLLDHVDVDDTTYVGIVVDPRYRKLSVGTTLVRAMLQSRSSRVPVIAECSSRNYAAVSLLRSCQFKPVAVDRYEMTWRYE